MKNKKVLLMLMIACLAVPLSNVNAMKFQENNIKNDSANNLEKETHDELQSIEENLEKIQEKLKNLDMNNAVQSTNFVKTQDKNTIHAAYDNLYEIFEHINYIKEEYTKMNARVKKLKITIKQEGEHLKNIFDENLQNIAHLMKYTRDLYYTKLLKYNLIQAKFTAKLLIDRVTIEEDTPEENKKQYIFLYNEINAGRSYIKKLENRLEEENNHPFKDILETEIKEMSSEIKEYDKTKKELIKLRRIPSNIIDGEMPDENDEITLNRNDFIKMCEFMMQLMTTLKNNENIAKAKNTGENKDTERKDYVEKATNTENIQNEENKIMDNESLRKFTDKRLLDYSGIENNDKNNKNTEKEDYLQKFNNERLLNYLGIENNDKNK